MSRTISNSDDIIDPRDVIARIEELQDQRDSAKDAATEGPTEDTSGTWLTQDGMLVSDTWTEDDETEYQSLKAFASDGEACADWSHGEAMIRDSYFVTYAQELADDLGYMNGNKAMNWPFTCIDWKQAARELQYDYTSAEFDGVTYWGRS